MANKDGEHPERVRWTDPSGLTKGKSFYIFTNIGMAEKWKKDHSIPLADVVQHFGIFKGEHGTEDLKPSQAELKNTFGSHKPEDIIPIMLHEGKIMGPMKHNMKSKASE